MGNIQVLKSIKQDFDSLSVMEQINILLNFSRHSKQFITNLSDKERSRMFCAIFCMDRYPNKIAESVQLLSGRK